MIGVDSSRLAAYTAQQAQCLIEIAVAAKKRSSDLRESVETNPPLPINL